MLSIGGERLNPKVLNYYLHYDLDMLQLLWCFFVHLLILEYPDDHQNLISSSLCYPGPLHKISSQSIHNFLSNVVHRQTDRQKHSESADLLGQGRSLLPYCPLWKCWALVMKDYPPLPPPPQKKKKKKFWIITCTTIWVCHHYYVVFLLIYSS